MKRVVVGHYGGPEVLQVVEEDDPRPGPGGREHSSSREHVILKLDRQQPPQAPVALLARSQPLQDWIGGECVRERRAQLRHITDLCFSHAPRKCFVSTHAATLASVGALARAQPSLDGPGLLQHHSRSRANSTPRSTGSRSPRPATTPQHAPTSSASAQKARHAAKRSAASNAFSSVSSSTHSNQDRH
jgi:hypothetical protein